MKEILIVSYHFYPDINPRSFRATELAKELTKMGHNVSVFTKNKTHLDDIKVIVPQTKSIFLNKIFKVKTLAFAFDAYNSIPQNTKYDLIISIGLPISNHIGTFLYKKYSNQNKNLKIIADYGDPYYTKFGGFKEKILRNLEKFILKEFDCLTIPIVDAIPVYTKIIDENKIQVIPQGINYKDIKVVNYSKNKYTTFAYAGLFYKDIRNPKVLLDYLVSINTNFRFIIYTNFNHPDNMEILESYIEKLGDKLIINSIVPREECIYELSKADFLIYQNNSVQVQKSSKIIDYMITNRPYFTFDQNNFDEKVFDNYLNGKYSDSVLDYEEKLKEFDINHIANQFLEVI